MSVVRRRLFDVVSFPAIYNAEDTALLPVLVYKSSKVSFVSEPLYHYLYRPGSLSTAKSEKIAESFYEAFHFLRQNISDEYKEEVCFRGIKMLMYGIFYNVVKAGGDIKKQKIGCVSFGKCIRTGNRTGILRPSLFVNVSLFIWSSCVLMAY